MGIETRVIHNASIMNAVGCCGLQLYNYGQTVSIVFWTETWKPDSFYDKIMTNRRVGLHTLCLLGTLDRVHLCTKKTDIIAIDIKVKEQSIENMARNRKIYEPPRYMTVQQCIDQLLEIEATRDEKAYSENTICVGLARVGAADQAIVSGTLKEVRNADLGGPLHSLILAGNMHFLEADTLKRFAVNVETFEKYAQILDR